MTEPGKLIVVEGPDGVGKSTLARELTSQLIEKGIMCECLAFPGNEKGTLGETVYRLHHGSEAFGIANLRPTPLQVLHVAAHIDAIEASILPKLASGRSVVLDRYWWSTWVYGLTASIDREVLEALIEVERKCWGSTLPSLVVLIERETPWRREEANKKWWLLVESYRELAKQEAKVYPIRSITNDGPVNQVAREIMDLLTQETLGKPSHQKRSVSSQLTLGFRPAQAGDSRVKLKSSHISKPFATKTTKVFDAYWRLAAERQAIFFRRFRQEPQPWTKDPIFLRHKFTNAYRASDRVSQFLIRHVIYKGEQTPDEVFFRTILFKLFNRISTWQLLEAEFGEVSYADYKHRRYDFIFNRALGRGEQIYSAAYIMPPAARTGAKRKHTGHLLLLERMMKDELPVRLAESRSLREAFELLRGYPMMGDFLAYQYIIDLNYGPLLNFPEMEFIVPGPGARRGIGKCFSHIGGLSEADVIRLVTERQEEEFESRGIKFENLWGRRLQLIDCQNLFCEIDKYARVAFPDLRVAGGGKRIKQVYRTTTEPIEYWYPPKWGLNEKIDAERRHNNASVRRPDCE
jgi:thymidylate kinase